MLKNIIMLKNILLLLICVIIIIYIIKYENKKKESFYSNPYSNYSNSLVNTFENSDDKYQYNESEECFKIQDLFNKTLYISIAFKDVNMNNYHNSKSRKLFCKLDYINVDPEFEQLLDNSLPYNNSSIYTGNNKEGNEWEIIILNKPIPPPPPGFPPPKLNTCGFLIRNIKFDRYLSYGKILKDLDNIQDNNIISEEETDRNIVYTGPSKYINENYLWDIQKIGCNKYSIQHVYSGLYLNSTIPNTTQDDVYINSEVSEINQFGEINCKTNKETIWFIIPTEPNDSESCEDPYTDCQSNLKDEYQSIGGKGNCCLKKLNTELCLQGNKKNKNSKVLNYPSSPWCGIKKTCS